MEKLKTSPTLSLFLLFYHNIYSKIAFYETDNIPFSILLPSQ